MNRRIVTFVGLALIAVLAIGQVFTAGRLFSDMENRYLETIPEATAESISSGKWMQQLETYLADHVPARNELVQLKNSVERLSGRRQIGQVVFAEEGRLIQVQNVTLEQLKENMKLISVFAQSLPEDMQISFLLAPTASWIYQDMLPEDTLCYDPEAACLLVETALPERVQLIVPYEVLQTHSDEEVYFRSDHHWTMRGAAYAYMELMASLKWDVVSPFSYETLVMGQNFKGSVYSQAPCFGYEGEDFEVFQVPGLEAEWSTDLQTGKVFVKEKLQTKDQYTAFLEGNYGLTRIVNEKAQSEEKLLILKDSYANILVPFLIEDFAEIVMVDLRYFRGSVTTLAEQEAVNRVICIYNLDFLCTDRSFAWLGV